MRRTERSHVTGRDDIIRLIKNAYLITCWHYYRVSAFQTDKNAWLCWTNAH